jgi:hypothetical protein
VPPCGGHQEPVPPRAQARDRRQERQLSAARRLAGDRHLVIDTPVATTGQCGEATFVDNTDQACRLLSAGAKLLCK